MGGSEIKTEELRGLSSSQILTVLASDLNQNAPSSIQGYVQALSFIYDDSVHEDVLQFVLTLLKEYAGTTYSFELVEFLSEREPIKRKDYLEVYALAAEDAGYPDRAISFYDQYLDAGGDISRILLRLGVCFLSKGDKEEAKELFEILGRTSHAGLSECLLGMAYISIADGELEKASVFLVEALKENPSDHVAVNIFQELASVCLSLNSVVQAIEYIERGLEKFQDPILLGWLANAYSRIKQPERAEQAAIDAIKQLDSVYTRRCLIDVYKQAQKYDLANQTLMASIDKHGLNPGFLKDEAHLAFARSEFSNCVDSLVQACESISINQIVTRKTFGMTRKLIPVMDPVKASQALSDFRTIADKLALPYFLAFGTLLGAVREGGFLKHDKDIDIGILPGANFREQLHAFTASGLFRFEEKYDEWFDCEISGVKLFAGLVHEPTGVCIDVQQFIEVGDAYYAGFHLHEDFEYLWKFTPFDLATIDAMGSRYSVPSNAADQMLVELYGDWQEPDPTFDTVYSAPNLTERSETIVLCYSLMKFLDSYFHGDWERMVRASIFLAGKSLDGDSRLDWAPAVVKHMSAVKPDLEIFTATE
jgi:tetratricopeptide (TPR) repeat protein